MKQHGIDTTASPGHGNNEVQAIDMDSFVFRCIDLAAQ